jgi:hypothetical protein
MDIRKYSRVAAIVVFLSFPAWAQSQCSPQSAVGKWAYNVAGWYIPAGSTTPVQVVGIGVFNIDWSGQVTGPATWAMAMPFAGTPIVPGQMLEYDFVSGSIQVTADCTGFLATMMKIKGLPVPAMGPYLGRIIVLPDKGEILAMGFLAPTTEKPMWTYTLRRMSVTPAVVEWPAAPASK